MEQVPIRDVDIAKLYFTPRGCTGAGKPQWGYGPTLVVLEGLCWWLGVAWYIAVSYAQCDIDPLAKYNNPYAVSFPVNSQSVLLIKCPAES